MNPVQITRQGPIATVSFDRGSKANALSLDTMRALTDAARSFEEDTDTAAIILTGRADNFSLGFDLRDPETQSLQDASLSKRRQAAQIGRRMCAAWDALEPLTISAIEGWCVGGGVALAVATDLRVVARSSNLYVPEVARGLNMSWGSVPRITNLVGPARAKRIILLAETLDAQRAVDWGLADEIALEGSALDAATAWAERAATLPPVALRMCKRDINAYANALADVASHGDFDHFALTQDSDDAREGIAAFFDKRTAHFKG